MHVHAVALTSDESKLVSCSSDGTVRTWTVEAGDSYGQVRIHAVKLAWSVVDLAVCAFAAASEVGWILDCSRDSSKIIIGSDNDRLMHVWSTRTGQVSMPR